MAQAPPRFPALVPAVSSRLHRLFALAAVAACLIVTAARLAGPSDLHDQSQERTSAYTTDLVLHAADWRRWILPMQHATHPATKPPLYNWLAAPAVWLTEGRHDWPHRLPSLAAFAGVCILLWWAGRRIDPGGLTGPLGVLILSSNYAWFKLSALIRPDTLLSLWLALGWVGITIVLGGEGTARSRRFWQVAIWSACALAVLTKGPPALLIPVFAAALPWFMPGGSFNAAESARALRTCGAVWGIPLALSVTGVWLLLVWRIDPDHLYRTLIREEFVDRALGTGEEGVKEGPWDFVRTALNMPLYFLTRFLPWSIFFLGALYDLRGSRGAAGPAEVETPPPVPGPVPDALDWVRSGVVYTFFVVLAFTLAAGKRSDYIASAYVSASLVTAWCLSHLGWRLARTAPSAVIGLAGVTVAALILHDRMNGYSVKYPLSASLRSFARQVRPMVEEESLPMEFYRTGAAPIQTMLHRSQPVILDPAGLVERIESHGRVWLIAADRGADEVLAQALQRHWRIEELATSSPAKASEAAPAVVMTLYHITSLPDAPAN